MKRHWFARPVLTLLLSALLGGCSELTDPEGQVLNESELIFVRLDENAPGIDTTEVSFWAVRGQEREVQIRYFYEGTNSFSKCMRFVVPANALSRRPDGSAIAPGDSVRITIRMPDPTRLGFEFDPAGLQFDPAHPATVEVVYRYADRDFNGDGVVDATDDALAARLGFWRQERPGEPWTRIETTRLEDVAEARATIAGFTKYALAID
jgi:hypothetical protein